MNKQLDKSSSSSKRKFERQGPERMNLNLFEQRTLPAKSGHQRLHTLYWKLPGRSGYGYRLQFDGQTISKGVLVDKFHTNGDRDDSQNNATKENRRPRHQSNRR